MKSRITLLTTSHTGVANTSIRRADCWFISDPEAGCNDENGNYHAYTKEEIDARNRKQIEDEILEEKRKQVMKDIAERNMDLIQDEIKKLPAGWTVKFDVAFQDAGMPSEVKTAAKHADDETLINGIVEEKKCRGQCPDCQCDMHEEVGPGNVWGYGGTDK